MFSPILANIYLHYVFDPRSHAWRHKNASGDMIVVLYADDTVATTRPSRCESTAPAKSAAFTALSRRNCAGVQPSRQSSVTSRPTVTWTATSSRAETATTPTPYSPPPVTTSA